MLITRCYKSSHMRLSKFRPTSSSKSWVHAYGFQELWLLGAFVTSCIGTVESYHGLLAGRIFLGVAESGQYPGVTYYLSAWYGPQDLGFVSSPCIYCVVRSTHAYYSKRSGLFFSAAGIAGAFSGLLGYAISKMDGVGGYEGWRWM
jgi:MFS family permease